jgi:hypothetical protein
MLPCASYYENVYLQTLGQNEQDVKKDHSPMRPASQTRPMESRGRKLMTPNSKFSEKSLDPSSYQLLREAEICISKIKMQVSGIEVASQIHSHLFNKQMTKVSSHQIGTAVVDSTMQNNQSSQNRMSTRVTTLGNKTQNN